MSRCCPPVGEQKILYLHSFRFFCTPSSGSVGPSAVVIKVIMGLDELRDRREPIAGGSVMISG